MTGRSRKGTCMSPGGRNQRAPLRSIPTRTCEPTVHPLMKACRAEVRIWAVGLHQREAERDPYTLLGRGAGSHGPSARRSPAVCHGLGGDMGRKSTHCCLALATCALGSKACRAAVTHSFNNLGSTPMLLSGLKRRTRGHSTRTGLVAIRTSG